MQPCKQKHQVNKANYQPVYTQITTQKVSVVVSLFISVFISTVSYSATTNVAADENKAQPSAKIAKDLLATDHTKSLQQAITLFEQQQFDLAEKAFKSLVLYNKTSAMSHLYLARIALENNDTNQAEKELKNALKQANKPAEVYALSGVIYAKIAQQASIFSALGYAKKSLKGFKKAVSLDPANIEYRQMLMGFYLGAPSIAGGDEALAMEQAQTINNLDEIKGYIAIGEALFAMNKKSALTIHLKNTPAHLQQNSQILLAKGFIYQRQKNYLQAFANFKNAIDNIEKKPNPNEEQLKIQQQALYQLGKTSDISKQQLPQGIAALTQYIAMSPEDRRLASIEWAKFRLANLMVLQGDADKANQLYQEVASTTTDKNLKNKIADIL
jgi:tetratricopeptide (TPR) repeat protein